MEAGSAGARRATPWSGVLRRTAVAFGLTLAALLSLTLPTNALAGDVRGVIEIAPDFHPIEPSLDEPRDHLLEQPNGVVPVAPVRFVAPEELSVVLIGDSAEPPVGCSYALRGGGLTPATMVAKAGTELELENYDGFSYELHVNGIEGFAAGPILPGSIRSIRVPTTVGVFSIHDAVQPHVQGRLHVIPDLVACGVIAANGEYRFRDVVPGEYTVRVYFQDEVVGEDMVVVEDDANVTVVRAISIPSEGGR